MKENQEQKLNNDNNDIADIGNDINSSYKKLRQNKIIMASVALVACLLIFIIINNKDPKKKKEEIKIEKSLENKDKVNQIDDDNINEESIGDLGIEIEKNDIIEDQEGVDLSLKIPPLPELKIDIPIVKIEDDQKKDQGKKIIEEMESVAPDFAFNNSYDDVIVKNGKQSKEGKERKKKLKEKKEKSKEEKEVITDPRKTPIVLYGESSGNSHPESSMVNEDNIVIVGESDISKIKESSTKVVTTIVKNRDNIITQGKKITAILETAINTEVPGFVRAIISRDVYPEQGSKPLNTRGSRIYGSYTKDIQRGQERVNISWTRLIRPDGVEVAINFNASDEFGRAGIEGDVDNKYGNIIKNSILSSVLAIGSGAIADLISGDNNTAVSGVNGTSSITSSAVSSITTDITGKLIDVVKAKIDSFDDSPIIRIPQGTKISIIVQADMQMPHMQNY